MTWIGVETRRTAELATVAAAVTVLLTKNVTPVKVDPDMAVHVKPTTPADVTTEPWL
jgi:hypothetical protein